jgi:GTP-binding protein EngB required for normal cell division
MLRSAQELQRDLKSIRILLDDKCVLSLSNEEKKHLLDDSIKLAQKLDRVAESSLVVGLLGGTGVGKSSLMNALACSPIASTSHRRPHTDQVLIYHHASVALPDTLNKSPFLWRAISHDAEMVRHIILCDLPDFDSLLTGHREQVLQFLEYLDILVWVVSPEKYADEKFYTLLRQVPKAKQNFYFVLNKVDLLFPHDEPGTGYSQLASLMARFMLHLKQNGIVEPIIYAVSAREDCDSNTASGWNHFWNFRNQLFRLRDAKEIKEIKAANLDVEVRQLAQVLEKEVFSLNLLRRVLQDFARELESRRFEWIQIGREMFKGNVVGDLEKEYLAEIVPSRALVGVGYAIASLVRDWSRLTQGSDSCSNTGGRLVKLRAFEPLQHELERLKNQMAYRFLREGLSSGTGDYGGSLFDVGAEWSDLLRRLQEAADRCLANHSGFSVKGFRMVQYTSYLLLFLFLLLGVAGETALRNIVEHPDWYNIIGLIPVSIQRLFSPNGFAALGSYMLLQAFLGVRFYWRYKKLLQRHAQKFIESLKLESGWIWEEELNILVSHLREKAQEVEGRMAALSALCRSETKD